jgi:hypothetical protein
MHSTDIGVKKRKETIDEFAMQASNALLTALPRRRSACEGRFGLH